MLFGLQYSSMQNENILSFPHEHFFRKHNFEQNSDPQNIQIKQERVIADTSTRRLQVKQRKRAVLTHFCSTVEKPDGLMSIFSHFADWEEAGYDLRSPDAGLEPLLEPLRRGLPR